MRVVFMGSPPFALPSLQALDDQYEVVAVVCQPDRPAGRGRVAKAPSTKIYAEGAGIPVYQPERMRDVESVSHLDQYRPELIVVAAYGQILPQTALDLPARGRLNVHASLLPRWRGAAPIQAAIHNGDEETGITIMQMDAGLDTGPIIRQRAIKLAHDETGGSLSNRLSELGAQLLSDTLPEYLAGEIEPRPQHEALATLAPMLKKNDGALDHQLSAARLERQVRAFDPWPGTFILWDDHRLAVKRAHVGPSSGAAPGTVSIVDNAPAVVTPDGSLILDVVQPAGGREMSGEAFLRGAPAFVGAALLE